MRTARRGKIIWSYIELGNQAQTIRMIVENQNASDGVATTITFDILKAPLNAPYGSNHPTSIDSISGPSLSDPTITVSATLSGTNVTLTFSAPFTDIAQVALVFRF